jgi:hypothetical protein
MGSWTLQSNGSGMYRIMRSVLENCQPKFHGRIPAYLTYVTFVTTKARYLEMLRAQSSPGYGYTCHSLCMGWQCVRKTVMVAI